MNCFMFHSNKQVYVTNNSSRSYYEYIPPDEESPSLFVKFESKTFKNLIDHLLE